MKTSTPALLGLLLASLCAPAARAGEPAAILPLATAGSRPFAYYATVVARLDVNDQPQKAFGSVTDTAHLDVYPRLELIDALDPDARGRGALLFRQYSDVGISYALYRVFPYNMEKVFEGGSSL